MEKLGQLRHADEWDLIVVDTPPSRSALDFLDAPQRLGRFLDGLCIRLLTAPAKTGMSAMRVLNAGFAMMTSALTKILGAQVLKDAQTFVTAFDTMFGGFRERAEATYRLLQAPGTAFLVVAAPSRTRCARRPTSSSGSIPSACRSPGWASSTGCTPRPPDGSAPHGAWPPPRPWKCRISRTGRARRPPVRDRRGGAAHARGADAPEQAGAAPSRALHLGAPGHPGRRGDRPARGRARPRRAEGDRHVQSPARAVALPGQYGELSISVIVMDPVSATLPPRPSLSDPAI